MKKIKRIARLLGLVCLIVLASIGMGISGGVPIPLLRNRREPEKENTELVEKKNKKSDSKKVIQATELDSLYWTSELPKYSENDL